MAYELADSTARSDIECCCDRVMVCWYDTAGPMSDSDRAYVDFALRYLDGRGLLNRHPDRPDLVNFDRFNFDAAP